MTVSNFEAALDYLQQLRAKSPSLDAFLYACQALPVCRQLDLTAHLLSVVQRPPRCATASGSMGAAHAAPDGLRSCRRDVATCYCLPTCGGTRR